MVTLLLRETTTPSHRMRLGGKATKRSRFGSSLADQKESTLIASMACEKANLHYHVIDSERSEHYLQSDEFMRLVSRTRTLRTVLTVSSRHSHSAHYLRRVAPLLRKTDRMSLNLVVGNPSYLSPEEAKSSSIHTLANLAALARKLLPENEIFIGTEGLLDASLTLAKSHGLIPFFLLDRNLEYDLLRARGELSSKASAAVYVPYLVCEQRENLAYEILSALGPYIVRRRWVQMRMIEKGYEPGYESVRKLIEQSKKAGEGLEEQKLGRLLMDCASELAIYGDTPEVVKGFRSLFDRGINIIVGSPVKDLEEQVMALGRCLALASLR